MKRDRRIFSIGLLFVLNIVFSQSLMNGYGFGGLSSSQSASVLGLGNQSLVSSFQSGVSLQNPATWMDLKFTKLNISYLNDQSVLESFDALNGQTLIGRGQLIIPIKEKYSFGLGLAPYRNQSISIFGEKETYIAFGDTLSTQKSLYSYGGINALFVGFGLAPKNEHRFGTKIHLLFGSTRQSLMNNVGGIATISNARFVYSGVLVDAYYNTNFEYPVNIFASVQFAYKPLSYISKLYHPFDDTNQSGYHDSEFYSMDFPNQSDISLAVENRAENIHNPSQYQLGFEWRMKDHISLSGELLSWEDKGDYSNLDFIMPLNDYVKSRQEYGFSLIRFTPALLAPKFWDKFQLRAGVHSSNYQLANELESIKEMSISFGFGFKFNVTGNQIDFAFRSGKRTYRDVLGVEYFQHAMVELSLSDLWFIKRRGNK